MQIVDNQVAEDGEAPLSDRIVRAISDAIISGDLPGGARLRESELASRFGVSRAPLREALRLLEERRLIERLPYSGVRVIQLTLKMVADLYEIRAALEAIACQRAAQRITPDDIAALEAMLAAEGEQIDGIERDRQRRLSPIRDFHTRLAEIAGNDELLRLLSRDLWRHARSYYHSAWKTLSERSRAAHFEHVAILEALKHRDGELAALLMRRHIDHSRAILERHIAEQDKNEASAGGQKSE